MVSTINKVNKSIRLFPIFSSIAEDLIFFIPIDILFLSIAKELTASEITAITMVSALVCIIFQKLILKLIKKVGNTKAVRLGTFIIFISTILLTFGKTFPLMLIYRSLFEIGIMLMHMTYVILKNNLKNLSSVNEYYNIRNKANIGYAITTMITALLSGWLFNINNNLPMYLQIVLSFIIFIMSFNFCEIETVESVEKTKKEDNKKMKLPGALILLLLSTMLTSGIIKLGLSNSKLFMQYDFQEYLAIENVTYFIAAIAFVSRVVRVVGNFIFEKAFMKFKDKTNIILSLQLPIAFVLLIFGHYAQIEFMYKVIIMASGFCMILATRDNMNVYIDNLALKLVDKEEQENIITKISAVRNVGNLLLSTIFTFVLMRYELIVVIFSLLSIALIGFVTNSLLYNKVK